jgi:hypothetical protein
MLGPRISGPSLVKGYTEVFNFFLVRLDNPYQVELADKRLKGKKPDQMTKKWLNDHL